MRDAALRRLAQRIAMVGTKSFGGIRCFIKCDGNVATEPEARLEPEMPEAADESPLEVLAVQMEAVLERRPREEHVAALCAPPS
mmetsp:Transcript_3712/g.8068  ORF Transcript_3712/g.8068 Transcript_3712/m.8068 type:complete len:84 (-) Transcript_3712:554-805(-)